MIYEPDEESLKYAAEVIRTGGSGRLPDRNRLRHRRKRPELRRRREDIQGQRPPVRQPPDNHPAVGCRRRKIRIPARKLLSGLRRTFSAGTAYLRNPEEKQYPRHRFGGTADGSGKSPVKSHRSEALRAVGSSGSRAERKSVRQTERHLI
jgi:hypothetical protein